LASVDFLNHRSICSLTLKLTARSNDHILLGEFNMTASLSDYNLPITPPVGFFNEPIRRDVWQRVALAVQVMAETPTRLFRTFVT
jgi:hypothetical protein